MVNSVASAASSLTQAQVGSQVSTTVARKALDIAERQGAAAVSLIEDAAVTQKAMVAKGSLEPFKGQLLDVTA
ncbi:MAG: YjfB family protein [Planctomycetota bacterium]